MWLVLKRSSLFYANDYFQDDAGEMLTTVQSFLVVRESANACENV